jgi:hypothetical protein
MDFRLPNLGEGIDSATVTAVLVKPGDVVSAGQNVISVETDKAAMEIEADIAGYGRGVAGQTRGQDSRWWAGAAVGRRREVGSTETRCTFW